MVTIRNSEKALPAREQAHFSGAALAMWGVLATLLFRWLYYAIAPWVWSKNATYPPGTLAPYIEYWNAERDGIEIYVLYAGMFLIISSVFFLAAATKTLRHSHTTLAVAAAALALIAWNSEPIVFTAPAVWSLPISERLLFTGLFVAALVSYLFLQQRISRVTEYALGAALLFLAAFTAVDPPGLKDMVYVFAPAQKLVAGHSVSDIYMQYEFFLTATAALWMKAGGSITNFHLVGQASYFVAILVIFMISRKMFQQRGGSWLLLIALVTIRILSSPWEPLVHIQISPIRLDLWLIVFVLIYLRGPFHWLVPASCGILMLVHGSFGVLYTIAYVQLLATLAALRVFDQGLVGVPRKWIPPAALGRLAIGGCYLVLCYAAAQIVFGQNIEAVSQYRKIGIGFIPVAKSSFFWVFPATWAATFAILLLIRRSVTMKYLALAFALIYFTIGNGVYFFGRSHEMVLFSIAISLVFSVFLFFDVLGRWVSSSPEGTRWNGKVPLVCGVIFLATAVYACLDRISVSLPRKLESVLSLRFQNGVVPPETHAEIDAVLVEVREQTGESAPLEFMISEWVTEYLFNAQTPGNTAFFYPSRTWIFVDSMTDHAQSVLDRGVHLLFDTQTFSLVGGQLRHAGQSYEVKSGDYVLVLPP